MLSSLISATGKVKDENHEGDDEENVDESTGDTKSESAAPKQQKKNSDY